MKKLVLIALTVSAFLSSCSSKSEKVSGEKATLYGTIENSDITYMMLVNMDRDLQDTIHLEEDGSFRYEVDASEHHLFTLFYKQDILEMYLEPGSTLELVSDANKFMANPMFKGTAAEVATVMNKKLTITTGVTPQELIQMDPEGFLNTLDGAQAKVDDMVRDAKIDDKLKKLLSNDAFFTLLPLREGYAQRKMKEIAEVDSTAFFAYKTRIESELKNEANLESTAFKMYLLNYLQENIMAKHQTEMREAGDRWIIVLLEKVPTIIENETIADYCFQLLYRNMMMGRMVQMPDGIVDDVVSTFKRLVKNPKYEKDIDAEYTAYKQFKSEQTK